MKSLGDPSLACPEHNPNAQLAHCDFADCAAAPSALCPCSWRYKPFAPPAWHSDSRTKGQVTAPWLLNEFLELRKGEHTAHLCHEHARDAFETVEPLLSQEAGRVAARRFGLRMEAGDLFEDMYDRLLDRLLENGGGGTADCEETTRAWERASVLLWKEHGRVYCRAFWLKLSEAVASRFADQIVFHPPSVQ